MSAIKSSPGLEDLGPAVNRVLERMYNWKCTDAYVNARNIPNFDKAALLDLKFLHYKFGNCGWQEGIIYNKIRLANNRVAKALGLKWDDTSDFWVRRKAL